MQVSPETKSRDVSVYIKVQVGARCPILSFVHSPSCPSPSFETHLLGSDGVMPISHSLSIHPPQYLSFHAPLSSVSYHRDWQRGAVGLSVRRTRSRLWSFLSITNQAVLVKDHQTISNNLINMRIQSTILLSALLSVLSVLAQNPGDTGGAGGAGNSSASNSTTGGADGSSNSTTSNSGGGTK